MIETNAPRTITEPLISPSGLNGRLAADELHNTLCDALSGWKYIREVHGDLYGVGWDRVQKRLECQITESADRIRKAANRIVNQPAEHGRTNGGLNDGNN